MVFLCPNLLSSNPHWLWVAAWRLRRKASRLLWGSHDRISWGSGLSCFIHRRHPDHPIHARTRWWCWNSDRQVVIHDDFVLRTQTKKTRKGKNLKPAVEWALAAGDAMGGADRPSSAFSWWLFSPRSTTTGCFFGKRADSAPLLHGEKEKGIDGF